MGYISHLGHLMQASYSFCHIIPDSNEQNSILSTDNLTHSLLKFTAPSSESFVKWLLTIHLYESYFTLASLPLPISHSYFLTYFPKGASDSIFSWFLLPSFMAVLWLLQ